MCWEHMQRHQERVFRYFGVDTGRCLEADRAAREEAFAG